MDKYDLAKTTAIDIIAQLEMCSECPFEFTTCPCFTDLESEDCEVRDIIAHHVLAALSK